MSYIQSCKTLKNDSAIPYVACKQALGRMKGERKEEGLYAHLKCYCSAPILPGLLNTLQTQQGGHILPSPS